jgi:hypothetical protein
MNESAVSKECPVCFEECNKFLRCSQHEDHCICSTCAYNIIENPIYVNPDASIDIKWKCPLCRHDNPIGCWQFLPEQPSIPVKEPQSSQPIQPEPPQLQANIPLTNNDERYTTIRNYNWPNSMVNHFKAWYIYRNTHFTILDGKILQNMISPAELIQAKITHNYQLLKNSREAPWYQFLCGRPN